MSSAHGYQQYTLNEGATTGQGRLVVMAYEGMIRYLHTAEQAMCDRNFELQNSSIQRVQSILSVLSASLDEEAYPEMCANLASLYDWFYIRLTEANLRDDPEIITGVRQQIDGLREAWRQAEQTVKTEQIPLDDSSLQEAA